MATCVDLAQAKYPNQIDQRMIIPMQGKSLKPLLTGEGTFPNRTLFWEHEGNAAIRDGDDKLVRQGMGGTWELFDMEVDRTEQHDRAQDNPERAAELQKRWRDWARSANVLPKPGRKKGKKAQSAERD